MAKRPRPQWDRTNKVWRWWDSASKRHVRLAKASKKTDADARREAAIALERYLADRDPSGPVQPRRSDLLDRARKWVSENRARANKGEISHEYPRKAEVALNRLLDCIGESASLVSLSKPKTIVSYRDCMMASDLQPKTIKIHYGYVRRFIRELWQDGHLSEIPRNLGILSIEAPPKFQKDFFTAAQLKTIWTTLYNQKMTDWELWFLLALNCGMQEADISELKVGEWRTVQPPGCIRFQRLNRRRTKTKRKRGVPPMEHCLWRRTWELLRLAAKGKTDGSNVFLRPNGKTLRYETPGGGSVNNYLSVRWRDMIETIVPANPLGFNALRKSGSNLCEKRIPGSKSRYLTHSGQSIADRHYANFPLERLDEVLSYIERDLGLVDALVIRSPTMTRGK